MNRLGHLHHFIVSECLNVCVNISTVVLSKNFTMEGKKSCPWHIHYFLLTIVQCSALLSFPDPYQPHCRVWMEYLIGKFLMVALHVLKVLCADSVFSAVSALQNILVFISAPVFCGDTSHTSSVSRPSSYAWQFPYRCFTATGLAKTMTSCLWDAVSTSDNMMER